jgi:hypothetical protein
VINYCTARFLQWLRINCASRLVFSARPRVGTVVFDNDAVAVGLHDSPLLAADETKDEDQAGLELSDTTEDVT